jgi:hypothetical protein
MIGEHQAPTPAEGDDGRVTDDKAQLVAAHIAQALRQLATVAQFSTCRHLLQWLLVPSHRFRPWPRRAMMMISAAFLVYSG